MKRNLFQNWKSLSRSRYYTSSLAMSFSESHQDYTLAGLQDYSKTLVDSNLDREEFARSSVCIAIAGGGGHAISTLASTPGASSLLLEGNVVYDRKSYLSYVDLPSNTASFPYSSLKAAKMASEAALKRALLFRSSKMQLMPGCIGIGCASTLVSSSPDSPRGSGYIVATRADGRQLSLNVSLTGKLNGSVSDYRNRNDEDVFISHLILRSIELIQNDEISIKTNSTKTDIGDLIEEDWGASLPKSDSGSVEEIAVVAANRILEGDEDAVVLLPTFKDGHPNSYRALKLPVIPHGSLVFPGSINPPHVGHISLAKAAVRTANRVVEKKYNHHGVFMELSLTNADKPPIDPKTVSDRISRFCQLDDLPEKWGVILSRAPLFSQKVSTLQSCVIDTSMGPVPEISFVIGTDTLVRILNPKYYGNEESAMLEALRSMTGVHFLVGGRLEQIKGSSEPPRFVSGREELTGLPEDVKAMFTIIEEEDFRVDISSTEIRKQEEERVAAL